MQDQPSYADTLKQVGDAKSSARVLSAIKEAERIMLSWQDCCDDVDKAYSRDGVLDGYSSASDWADPDYDLFWSSMEILKPAVYAHPPQAVVTPKFRDRDPVKQVTSEMLERAETASMDRGGIDEVMLCVRDDLIFYNRGQIWLTYETDREGGGQRVCYEHLDRKDFGHEPARKWADVGFVWRRAWMTREEMRDRFQKSSGDAWEDAAPAKRNDTYDRDSEGLTDKIPVYEVWHKRDNRVYWVTDGVPVMLDDDEPHLKLRGFFPCPRPAYGTLRPRTLEPVPDYLRYRSHFKKIDRLTKRIYLLLDRVKLKGLIPAGGDIGDAIEELVASDSDELLIPVPGAALMAGSASGFVTWMPLADIATAIQGLIEARGQLIQDFYQLSGISDIMRGATDAQETLGAQKLKSQYGSIRVREKVDELQRIARDVTQIAAEVMSEHFSRETLLEMSQMDVPTRSEIKKEIKDIEADAEKEMKALGQAMEDAARSGQADPKQLQQQLQSKKQEIAAKYAPLMKEAEAQVVIEDVMDLLRDDKARSFAFEIATDSTILTDEQMEKESRGEFLQSFLGMGTQLMELAQLGPAGANLAGELLRFALAPYRVGRQLDAVIDEFIDAAPQMAEQAAAAAQGEQDEGLAAAQMKLAEAEMAKVQSQTEANNATAQLKMQELQLKASEAQAKAQQDQQNFALSVQDTEGRIAKTKAEIDKVHADIQLAQQKLGLEANKEQREDIKAAADIQMRGADQAMAAQDRQRQAVEGDRNAAMSERQQSFSEQQGQRAEDRADRQQSFTEKTAAQEKANG